MGTWDIGPFDKDTSADFGDDLDEAAAGEREGVVRSTLTPEEPLPDLTGLSSAIEWSEPLSDAPGPQHWHPPQAPWSPIAS
ncbi:DUF4259 domain-containing protein [Streptomyces sp. NPDC088261]|uniref:DUF4259 domain-containing protein n=1 Tax=Streptomyces sp. NPDC088261 TaxID=3365851 RepID=UPI0038031300